MAGSPCVDQRVCAIPTWLSDVWSGFTSAFSLASASRAATLPLTYSSYKYLVQRKKSSKRSSRYEDEGEKSRRYEQKIILVIIAHHAKEIYHKIESDERETGGERESGAYLEDLRLASCIIYCKSCRIISSVLKSAKTIDESVAQELPAARDSVVEVSKDSAHCVFKKL